MQSQAKTDSPSVAPENANMVERVGRAICSLAAEPGEDDYDLDKIFWDRVARAAIEAMREPTDGMIAAGYSEASLWAAEGQHASPPMIKAGWQGMIDDALADGAP